MKLVCYTIVDQIDKLITEARRAGKGIKHIELTPAELRELLSALRDEGRSAAWNDERDEYAGTPVHVRLPISPRDVLGVVDPRVPRLDDGAAQQTFHTKRNDGL